MSYIFRLHNEGNNAITDWGISTKFGSSVIDQIQDPNGESAKREITSIPSPFARIDLVKTAFKKVADAGIDGDSIHHKMVSECFDIGQIFFDFEKFRDKFDIIVWDKIDSLNELLNSPYLEHQQLGDTYKTYLKQDGLVYNFDKMQRMYFLNYKSGPAEMNIIGATSPATLFFTSANDLYYVSDAIKAGNDRFFDDEFTPLYKRDIEYQKFWYALRKSVANFSRIFPEVEKYLVENIKKLDQQKRDIINAITKSDYQKYASIGVGEGVSHTVSVLEDIELRQRVQNTANIADISGFVIQSSNSINGVFPLVLPVDTYVHKTIYTQDTWDKNTKVPYYDNRALKDRTLPSDEAKYPYLTISDFLTNTIVRMPYEIDNKNFFDGNINKTNGNSYLLPLTNTFFHFFNVKDLTEKVMSDGKKMFELEDKATGVTAVLRIPIRNNYIEYRRTYFEAGVDANETKNTNDGAILDKKIGLGIMPLIRFPENVNKYFRIALFDKGRNNVKLTYYKENKLIAEEAHITRDEKDIEMNECSKESYVITHNFDRINVEVGDVVQGVIIPKFKSAGGNKIFTFAIDFGTTNSHIEYGYVTSAGQNPSSSEAFSINPSDKQLYRLHTKYADKDINGAFEHNFIPDTIGDKDDDFSFPMRTVFSEWSNINSNGEIYALANGNIPFLFEKKDIPSYNEAKTELKWRGDEDDYLVKLYIENIFLLLRNKVILNSGNLEATKIIWFYPASMDTGKYDNFNAYWEEYYKKYFGDNVANNLITISESAAPHRYYKRKKGASSEVVTIDVGGGTTDVYVVTNDKPEMLLSFLFASTAIFGDGGIGSETRWDADMNGFIQKYYQDFVDQLDTLKIKEGTKEEKTLEDYASSLKQIRQKGNSPDIVAFLFSLSGNKDLKEIDKLNFLKELTKNKKFKYVFIIFYGAILYYIAKAMKIKGLKQPLTLAFSGNGSKTLDILTPNDKTKASFAKLIFDGVYGTNTSKLDVIFEDEPKKATSKGGILNPAPQTPADIKKIKFTLIGDDLNCETVREVKYEEITESVQIKIIDSVVEFVEFLFNLHYDNDDFFTSSLSADETIIDVVKEICKDRVEMEQSLKAALSNKRGNKKVEETLFFYPLIGVLHELARKVNEGCS